MLTWSVMLNNSTVAIQKAATLQCSLTSRWRPWLCSASTGPRPTLIGSKVRTLESKQRWNTVLPWIWSLFLLSSAVALCFLLQMWMSATLTRAKGRAAASTLTVPTPVSATVATARWSPRTGSPVKVSHSNWQQWVRRDWKLPRLHFAFQSFC